MSLADTYELLLTFDSPPRLGVPTTVSHVSEDRTPRSICYSLLVIREQIENWYVSFLKITVLY